MPHLAPWRACQSFTTTGTGTITLGAAIAPDVAFSVQMTDGDTATFAAEEFDAVTGAASGAWEIFRGALGAGGTTITRDEVVRSSAGTSKINWAAGTKRVYALQETGFDVRVFTETGTTSRPLWARTRRAIGIGAGGGGGSGRRGAAGSIRTGGGGGGGGAAFDITGSALNDLPTETVTIGSAGSGGSPRTGDNQNGSIGGAGGDVLFGGQYVASGGGFGLGGSTGPRAGGVGGKGQWDGGVGAASNATAGGVAGSNAVMGGSGGGSGSSLSTANVIGAGGAGGGQPQFISGSSSDGGGGAGGSPDGGAVTDKPADDWTAGAGGGGGGTQLGAPASAGGKGQAWGGGGGGGAASENGFESGAGGAGGAGICIVIYQ